MVAEVVWVAVEVSGWPGDPDKGSRLMKLDSGLLVTGGTATFTLVNGKPGRHVGVCALACVPLRVCSCPSTITVTAPAVSVTALGKS